MEAAPGRDPALRVSPLALLREPLLWAAGAAFVGAAVGLLGTFWQARLLTSYDFELSAEILAGSMQGSGQAIAALSLLAVPALIGSPRSGSRATRFALRLAPVVGGVLLLVSAVASAAAVYYLWYLNTDEMRYDTGPPPALAEASFFTSVYLPPTVVVPFALVALARCRWHLGALLSGLCVLALPLHLVWIVSPSTWSGEMTGPVLLGFLGWGVSVPEAPLWGLLGMLFFRAARERSYGKAQRLEAEENRERARRLYEEGLSRGDLSVVDELVSTDFRDLRSGSRGKLGMERVLQGLWRSFPDLAVSIEDQEAEGDLVRTRLVLSGTDRGGVLWYPATNRHASFCAEFVDRFSGGALVEHGGSTDTEGLLRQLGHPAEDRSLGR